MAPTTSQGMEYEEHGSMVVGKLGGELLQHGKGGLAQL